MRLHQLEITAFGPFAGTQTVDFDALADAGLFLLCGPTGAGKTSVLDAVCFALYGDVPGDRSTAKRLRSDHADEGVGPSVRLEVTLNGRRFRLQRSPAWQRPKRRGTGMTTEQAKVVLEERCGEEWRTLSTRLDETGHFITELLGMNLTQFTQVAMLPQGRFAAFLRARSDERHKVLQQLFRTSRFEDVERWLVQRRQSLRGESRAHHEAVVSVVNRLSEITEASPPEAWDLSDLAVAAEGGEVARWCEGLADNAATEHSASAAALATATARADRCRAGLEAGRRLRELRDRYAAAERALALLGETEAEARQARTSLEAARRAVAVVPVAALAEDARARLGASEAGLAALLDASAGILGRPASDLTAETLERACEVVRDDVAAARALLPREQELRRAEAAAATAREQRASLREALDATQGRLTVLPVEIEAVEHRREELATLRAALPGLESRRELLRRQLDAAARAERLTAELKEAEESLRHHTDVAQTLREQLQDLREARINGMAAELAAGLAVGACCPVCGSAEHPLPAVAVAGSPTKADEEEARSIYEDADFARQAVQEKVATISRNLAVAVEVSEGRGPAAVREDLAEVEVQLRAASEAAGAHTEVVASLEALRGEAQRLHAESESLSSRLAAHTADADRADEQAAGIREQLEALLAGSGLGSVAALVARREDEAATHHRALEAVRARLEAVDRADEASAKADTVAVEQGFTDLPAALAASLPETEMVALEQQLRSRDDEAARAGETLRDRDVLDAVAGPAPDLAQLQQTLEEAEVERSSCATRSELAGRRAERIQALRSELERCLRAWAPTRAAYAVASTMSTFAEGKGGDNALQMRLSAYVLAARLRQVVDAANERLHRMSDERYSLEHSARRGAGEVRGGLSLLVRDEWTGEPRDPATLSGGETFVVSLALALGLADVVSHEVGGSDIDTLFIDEGFGSLDPDTLDDVMDTLDGLRDGGRVVGIVSHVPELRTRVPAQLQIRKERSGSRVVATREPA